MGTMFPHRWFSVLLGAVLCAVIFPYAFASSPAAPSGPSKLVIGTKVSDVCPDLGLYPEAAAGKERPSIMKTWQRDYPLLVYDARSQRRYWSEASTPDSPIVEITSTFVPVTYTMEKVLVAVCGLHFGQVVIISTKSIAVPNAGPQIQASSTTTGVDAAADHRISVPTNLTPAEICKNVASDINSSGQDLATYQFDFDAVTFLATLFGATPSSPDVFGIKEVSNQIFATKQNIASARSAPKGAQDSASYQARTNELNAEITRLLQVIIAYNTGTASSNFFSKHAKLQKDGPQLSADLSLLVRDIGDFETLSSDQSKSCPDDALHSLNTSISKIHRALADLETEKSWVENGQKTLQGSEINVVQSKKLLADWYQVSNVSSLFVLDVATVNTLEQISFTVTDPTPPAVFAAQDVSSFPQAAPAGGPPKSQDTYTIDQSDPKKIVVTTTAGSADNVTLKIDIGATASSSVEIASAPSSMNNGSQNSPPAKAPLPTPVASSTSLPMSFMERHRWINFAVGGGFLGTRFTNTTYSSLALPVTTVTTTTTTTSPTATPPTVTITSSASTANYALAAVNGPLQQTAVAGITWYMFGRDTYPVAGVKRGGPFIGSYGDQTIASRFGIFVGTSVSSLGTFTVGPTLDIFSGMSLYTGVSLQSRSKLAAGIVPCSSIGTNLATTNSSSTQTSPTGVSTTTTVVTQTSSNCANANATVLGQTSVPSNSTLKPAWGFGIMFNSNLLKYLGITKGS